MAVSGDTCSRCTLSTPSVCQGTRSWAASGHRHPLAAGATQCATAAHRRARPAPTGMPAAHMAVGLAAGHTVVAAVAAAAAAHTHAWAWHALLPPPYPPPIPPAATRPTTLAALLVWLPLLAAQPHPYTRAGVCVCGAHPLLVHARPCCTPTTRPARTHGSATRHPGRAAPPPRGRRWHTQRGWGGGGGVCAGCKAGSTLRSSRAAPHPSTNRALRRLTSEVERGPVHSTRYGRQRWRMLATIGHAGGQLTVRTKAKHRTNPARDLLSLNSKFS